MRPCHLRACHLKGSICIPLPQFPKPVILVRLKSTRLGRQCVPSLLELSERRRHCYSVAFGTISNLNPMQHHSIKFLKAALSSQSFRGLPFRPPLVWPLPLTRTSTWTFSSTLHGLFWSQKPQWLLSTWNTASPNWNVTQLKYTADF